MKAKDLMIGDYVTFKDCQKDDAPTIVKIEGLGYQGRGVVEEAIVSIDGDAAFDLVEINEEFVGIPLTPEILEQNGWRQYGPYFSNDNADFELVPYRVGGFGIRVSADEYGSGTFACIKYVHELQHALKLCGIEKEIVL